MALILIVDDSPTEVFVMQKALEKHGFKTAAAENGEEGIRKAKEMKPDLIFMDIVMPGVNGYQATRALINDPETSLIPIIMVTTKGQETDRVWGLRQGAWIISSSRSRRRRWSRRHKPRWPYDEYRQRLRRQFAELRDRPFELLKELEKRSRPSATGSAPDANAGKEWVGVAFRMGGETFLVAREETREVLGYPAVVTRIPGAKGWVKGLANIRGQLLPMLDLRQFLGSGATTAGRNTRSWWSITATFRRV
jgi:twitching motility two-component system response regulator PilH